MRAFLALIVVGFSLTNSVGQSAMERCILVADSRFGRAEYPALERMADSLAQEGIADQAPLALAAAIRTRLLRYQGKLHLAQAALNAGPLADQPVIDPVARLILANERASTLKAMQLPGPAFDAAMQGYHLARTSGMPFFELNLLVLLAELDRHQGRSARGLERLNEAEALAERIGNVRGRCNVALNRGNVFYDQDRHEEAIASYQEALVLAQQERLMDVARNAAFNIGAPMHFRDGPERVITYYDSLLGVKDLVSDRSIEADIRGNIGNACNETGQHRRALSELEKAITLYSQLHDTVNTADALLYRSATFLGMNEPDSALRNARTAADLAQRIGQRGLAADAELRIADVLRKMGRHDEAFDHLEKGHALREALVKARHSEHMGYLEIAFDTEKKEQALNLSNARLLVSQGAERAKHVQRNWFAGVCLLLLVLAVFLYRNISTQRKLRALEKDKHARAVNDLLKQQEINTLEAMMAGQERERERVGKDLHDRIGSMLSAVKFHFTALESRMDRVEGTNKLQYQQVYSLLDETVTEVRRISHDMVRGNLERAGLVPALEDLRNATHAPGTLDVSLHVHGMEERLPSDLEVAIYRMVQEAVSNALKHAHAKHLTIQLTRSPKQLNILVEDDGQGFDPELRGEGIGLGNIRERAMAHQGSVNIESAIGHGTSVSIDIPVRTLR